MLLSIAQCSVPFPFFSRNRQPVEYEGHWAWVECSWRGMSRTPSPQAPPSPVWTIQYIDSQRLHPSESHSVYFLPYAITCSDRSIHDPSGFGNSWMYPDLFWSHPIPYCRSEMGDGSSNILSSPEHSILSHGQEYVRGVGESIDGRRRWWWWRHRRQLPNLTRISDGLNQKLSLKWLFSRSPLAESKVSDCIPRNASCETHLVQSFLTNFLRCLHCTHRRRGCCDYRSRCGRQSSCLLHPIDAPNFHCSWSCRSSALQWVQWFRGYSAFIK